MMQPQNSATRQWQVSLPLSISDLIEMIAQLPPSAKHQLRDFLDEELDDDDSPEDLAEIQTVYAEYESGHYITLNEYLAKRRITL